MYYRLQRDFDYISCSLSAECRGLTVLHFFSLYQAQKKNMGESGVKPGIPISFLVGVTMCNLEHEIGQTVYVKKCDVGYSLKRYFQTMYTYFS